MSRPRWASGATLLATLSAGLTVVVVHVAQRHYQHAFAFRIARTTAAYIAAVTPPPPPPAEPRRPKRAAPVAPQPLVVAKNYDLPSLLTQSRALRTLPGFSSDVEVYYGTAPLVDATAPPLSPDDLRALQATDGRWREGAALVPLPDRDGKRVVGAVAVRLHRGANGPLPGGFGLVIPAALLAIAAAGVVAWRARSLRRGGYAGAAVILAVASYVDVRYAAKTSTDRWLFDARRLLQEAATRLPAPRTRVSIEDLAALVRDGDVVAGEPGESAARRVVVDGTPKAVVAVLIGPARWVELRSAPAERTAPPWLLVLLPCALLGPLAIWMLRWAERTAPRERRENSIAWTFLAPAVLHLAVFTIAPTAYAIWLAGRAGLPAVLRDPATWTSFRTTLMYALYVPVSIVVALGGALAVHRYRDRWVGRLLSAAFVAPYVSSVVAVALVWQVIARAASFGLGQADWLSDPRTALPALMLLSMWAHVGGQMLVLLAGLHRIPREFLDAARVDGAGAWRRLFRITLPLLRPVLGLVLVTGLISAMQMFTLVYVLKPPGIVTVVTGSYAAAWSSQAFGIGSAIALLLLFALVVLRWPQVRIVRGQNA